MRLSEFLQTPEAQKCNMAHIGFYKTPRAEFAVVAHKGDRLMPLPTLFQLFEVTPNDRDPETSEYERRAVLERFGYYKPISITSS
jgi:hypothetical protein